MDIPSIFRGPEDRSVSKLELAPEASERLNVAYRLAQKTRAARDAEFGVPYSTSHVEATSESSVSVAREAVLKSLDDFRPGEARPPVDYGQDAKVYNFHQPAPQTPEFRAPTDAEATQLQMLADSRAELNNLYGEQGAA